MFFVKIEKAGSIFVFLYSEPQSFILICFLNSEMFLLLLMSLNVYFRFWLFKFISNCKYWIII